MTFAENLQRLSEATGETEFFAEEVDGFVDFIAQTVDPIYHVGPEGAGFWTTLSTLQSPPR